MSFHTKSGFSQCVGGAQMTAGASAALPAIPLGTASALIKPRGDIYLRLHGGTATAADMLIEAGVPVEITGTLADARIFGTGLVDIWFFG